MSSSSDYEDMAKALEATGNYHILRRVPKRPHFAEFDGSETRQAIVLDLETTGLDPATDEIIEIGVVPFTYALDGRIFAVGGPFSGLREPSRPIPSEVSELTGITDAMVKGRSVAAWPRSPAPARHRCTPKTAAAVRSAFSHGPGQARKLELEHDRFACHLEADQQLPASRSPL